MMWWGAARDVLSAVGAIVGSLLLLSSCAQAPAAETVSAPPDAARVHVSVVQERPDVPKNFLSIKVANDGTDPLGISRATLTSPLIIAPLVWEGSSVSVVLPGRALDLRVAITAMDCAADAAVAAPLSVMLDTDDSTITLAAADPYDLIERLNVAACHGEKIAAVATLSTSTLTDAPLTTDPLTADPLTADPGRSGPALLTILVNPTGAGGHIVVRSILATTLLAPTQAGVAVGELVLNQTISADGPDRLQVAMVPNRCDAHGLAEDKVGTIIPLMVTAPDGSTARITLPASDLLRAQMYAFYLSYCGL